MIEFALYERKLNRAGVKLISITQPIGEDSFGEMARRMISLFDEYQSRENGKHTLRAMKENARQGYFNGARPPFGYRTEPVEAPGRKGTKKKLAIDDGEAAIIRKVFELYLHGERGHELGDYGIARTLGRLGISYRGKPWGKGRVEAVLTNRLYVGERVFNRRNHQTARLNRPEEWIVSSVPAIIPEATFRAVQAKRAARQPARVAPRVVCSPTLLTGLLKCGACGAGMTLATGKGGRYRYYKCSARIRRGTGCRGGSIATGKLDAAVRQALCERVFTEGRVRRMLEALRERLDKARGHSSDRLRRLRAEVERSQRGSERLYEAVERGFLPMDGTLTKRAHDLQVRRQALLAEIAGLEREKLLPVDLLSAKHVRAFCRALRVKMLDERSEFGKRYLRLLVEEIRVEGPTAVMRGSYAALAQAVSTKGVGTQGAVPTFGPGWLPTQDSIRQASGARKPTD